jgi:tRNA(fMet)-specific endonuclease VapC
VTLRLLDTNIWIALAHGEPGPVARLRLLSPPQVATCSIVRAELMFGARKSQRVAENLAGFRKLLEPFVSLPFDDLAAGHYGIIRATLERAGTLIGANDLLIAAIALAHDCLLVTRNSREFERVVGLRLETWE